MKFAEAFVEVARKEAAAPKKEKRRPWNVANIRSGRRPLSVSTMLKKEKDGTLQVKLSEAFADREFIQALLKLADLDVGKEYQFNSLGLGTARQALKGPNPDVQMAQNAQQHYQNLDPGMRKLIESHPLVAQHGMTPTAAHALGSQTAAQNGQSLGEFFAQQHLGGSGTPAPMRGGGGGPTGLPQAATNASGVRQRVTPAATAASPTGPAATPRPAPSVPVRPPNAAPSMLSGRSVAQVNPLGKTLAAGPAAAAAPMAAAVKKPAGAFGNLVGAAMGKAAPAPAQIAMKSVGGALSGAAKALPAVRPGGAMAGMFSKALKMASASPELLQALMKMAQFYGPIVPFTDQTDRGASPVPRSRLDKITSRENIENETPKREDGRAFVSFENAPGTQLNEVAATNSPQERTASVKFAGAIASLRNVLTGTGARALHANEVAGLGVLAVPAADTLQAHVRSHLAGEGSHGAEKRQLIGEPGHALAEIGGLGVLAGPAMHGLLQHAH